MQNRIARKPQREKLLAPAVTFHRTQAFEPSDAVGNVHNVIARLQVKKRINRPPCTNAADAANLCVAAEYFMVRSDGQGLVRPVEAAVDMSDAQLQSSGKGRVRLAQQLLETFLLGQVLTVDPQLG